MTDSPRGFDEALLSLDAAKDAIANLAFVVAQAYGTTKFRAKPIVDHHFTAGNADRYGWLPLSLKYWNAKMGNIQTVNDALNRAGLAESKADASQGKSKGNRRAGIKATGTTPMLVRTGTLRNVIINEGRIIKLGPGAVKIVWDAPDYAHWHVTGGTKPGRPPKRDFLQPNESDMKELYQVGNDYLRNQIMRRTKQPGGDV